MREQRRFHAMMLCIAFALVLLVSSAFIVHEADHECIGEDCPICQMIAMSTDLLRFMGAALAVFLAAAAILLIWQNGSRLFAKTDLALPSRTLISWKIRLND